MRIEVLDYADRWISDAFDEGIIPAGFVARHVDMSQCSELLQNLRTEGIRESFTPLIARAVALALKQNPDLQRMNIGNRRFVYSQVDLCISIAGKTAAGPTLVIPDAGNQTWVEIAERIREESRKVRRRETEILTRVRRFGWVVPLGVCRRAMLRWLGRQPAFRHGRVGNFQMTAGRGADFGAAFQFGTAGILSAAEVRDRAFVVDGKPVVRPGLYIGCSFNHRVWDGVAAMRFLAAVAKILEEDTLAAETSSGMKKHDAAGAG